MGLYANLLKVLFHARRRNRNKTRPGEAQATLVPDGQLKIPAHLAVIMDGNGRWAQKRGLPRQAGHRAGAENLRTVCRLCCQYGIQYLTVYAFSTENWNRPEDEVHTLMALFVEFIQRFDSEMAREGIRLRFSGDLAAMPVHIQEIMTQAETNSAARNQLQLIIAINFGGRRELVQACQKLAAAVSAGLLAPEDINETILHNALYLPDVPDPDLVIRPSGEQRLSNFLLWESAYAELWFADVLWPDFAEEHLLAALQAFTSRDRRVWRYQTTVKQRIITGILFTLAVALFVVPGYWHPLPPLILFIFVALQAARELVQALRTKGLQPNLVLASLGSLIMLLPILGSAQFSTALNRQQPDGFSNQLAGGFALMAFCLLMAMCFSVIGILIKRGPAALPDAAATAMVMAYIAFPLSCPVLLLEQVRGGWLWLLVGLTAPWISDSFAYFTGSLLGKHPIIPAISPKKTLEGCLGGMAGSMLILPLIFRLFGHTLGLRGPLTWSSIIFAIFSGLVLSVASQFGDWLASGIKRWCGIKDFGKCLPGHGGIMDRFDSAFFTLPMVLVLAVLYQMILP